MRETAIISRKLCIRPDFESKPRYGALTHFYICPTGRRDKQASSRHRNSSANRVSDSQDHLEECVHPQSPLRHDEREGDFGVMSHQSGSEEDNQYRTGREMRERDPAEHWWGTVGADPVDRVVVGPDVEEGPGPSQEPVLDGADTDQEELDRSLPDRVLGSWR